MRKTIIILALAVANSVLVFTRPRPHYNEARAEDIAAEQRALVALTINRVFHEQINGTWPQVYGSTMQQAASFEAEIIAANKANITDWTQYKP